MTTALAAAQTGAHGPQMATARSLRDLAHSRLENPKATRQEVEALDQKPRREWIAGRVATLLSHFYVSPLGEAQMAAIAADWHDVLSEFPEWAIQQACLDWLSGKEGAGKKPAPAQIAKAARWHYAVVPYIRQKLEREA